MSDDPTKVATVFGASAGSVVTVEAVVIKADGRRVDYGTIASSDPERVPVSPRDRRRSRWPAPQPTRRRSTAPTRSSLPRCRLAEPVTYRVAVRHTDSDHRRRPRSTSGPAINDQMADIIAHVRGVAPGEIDLLEEAQEVADRARQEYPEEDGWEVSIEAIVPHPDEDDRHITRLVEED
jgi:hypothetical protein